MLNIERLKEAELPEITEQIDELYEAYNVIWIALERFKTSLRETGETISTPIYDIAVRTAHTLEPAVDINTIIQSYPIEKYPDMYAIKLSKTAGDIIKEPEFLKEKETKSVIFRAK